MKRIRVHEFGGPEVLQLEDFGGFEPKADEVVVRVKAAGVNPYDTYMRAGSYGARNPELPFTPGSDAAGIVESIGADVTNVAVGDRVYTARTISGAYAEVALCSQTQVQPLPDRVSFAQGAGIYVPYATAYRSLFQLADAKAGETVLIHGASGGVGVAAIQFARDAGLNIIGTAGSEAGLQLIKAQGAQHVVNHHAPDAGKQILEIAPSGVNIILEMLANINLGKDLPLLAQRGRVIVVGSRGTVEINPRDTMSREAIIRGVYLWGATEPEEKDIYKALNEGLASGKLQPIVGTELPLASAAEAHVKIMESGAQGKIVLAP